MSGHTGWKEARRKHIVEMLAANLMEPDLADVPGDVQELTIEEVAALAEHLFPLVDRLIKARARAAVEAVSTGTPIDEARTIERDEE